MKKKFLSASMNLIKKYDKYDKEQLEIIAYGLEAIYLTFTKLVVILLVAFSLRIFKEIILLLISYNIIRSQAFGIHANKSIYCLISSLIMFVGGAFVCKFFILPFELIFSLSIVCNVCLLLYAPADTYKRPLVNKKKRGKFKLLSCLFGIIYTVLIIIFKDNFIVNYLLVGMIEAVIMILPITYKVFKLPYNNYKSYNRGV